jgi:hypothetical protein
MPSRRAAPRAHLRRRVRDELREQRGRERDAAGAVRLIARAAVEPDARSGEGRVRVVDLPGGRARARVSGERADVDKVRVDQRGLLAGNANTYVLNAKY